MTSSDPAGKPRLDYVSPLPPVRSGIADYSADLLPHLERVTDLRVVRLPGQEVAPEVIERWQPVAAQRLAEEGRLPLYQMGNNLHHEQVLRLALEVPGVLTLHDLVLHHLLLELTLGRGVYAPYLEALEADHGWVGAAVATPKRWGAYGEAGTFALAAHRGLLRRQRGVLVHSRWAAETLRREDPDLRVREIPMGVPLPPAPEAEAGRRFRQRHRLPEEATVLGSFGFQTPIKRTAAALAALARSELREAFFLVVGEVAPILDLMAEARRLGVADRVRVTGFVPFDEMLEAIAATDLCVNLRYPTAGETSASLLRILAAGRPAVVSDYAQFADLPEDVALRVPLGDDEVPVLAAAVRRLLDEPGHLAAMGRAAREHVRLRHDPTLSAAAVAEACAAWTGLEPPGEAPVQLPPPTSLAWGDLPGDLEVLGAEAPWPPGERRPLTLRLENHGPAVWLPGREGPGGVVVEVRLLTPRGDLMAERPWIPLPRPLPGGETMEIEVEVRRPPGEARLAVELHVLGGAGFSVLGGASWEAAL